MDELLHHCIRELAFEGDLGCGVNRLQDFIAEFYAHNGAKQTVDAAYCAFVWSVVVQHPEVRIGIAPEGAPEVYIAPQASKVAKGKKKKVDDEEDDNAVGKLEVIDDASVRPLDELKQDYGDKLRIAVDPERSLIAITGSHIKSSKLTPMVYTTLQLVSRCREAGLSAVDLSKKTGYDAKMCHYLIEKLVELNLVEKRKKSGVGTSFCIHKYFFDRSEVWQGVLAEEGKVRQAAVKKEEKDDVDIEDDVDDSTPAPSSVQGQVDFDPIDSRHLSSTAIVKDRLYKLLRNSPHYMHSAQNLLVTIGFPNPAKSDRRFFQTRLRELVAQGFIEKVQVPKGNGRLVSCLRLLNPEQPVEGPNAPTVIEIQDDEDELTSLKTNVTLQKQIIDLIHQSGTDGLTLNQLSAALGSFDKRTLDHQLNRLKDAPVPGHIRDLGVIQVAETYGRERRYKYFTFEHYRKIVEREKLGAQWPEGHFDSVGGFLPVEESQFYTTEAQLNKFVDGGNGKGKKKGKGKERERAYAAPKTPVRGKKRKRDEVDEEDAVDDGGVAEGEASSSMLPPLKKKRGRPPKARPQPPQTPAVASTPNSIVPATPQMPSSSANEEPPTTAKKRGRPRKNAAETPTPTVPKKRGRPPKNRASAAEIEVVATNPAISPGDQHVAPTKSTSVQLDAQEASAVVTSASVPVGTSSHDMIVVDQLEQDIAVILDPTLLPAPTPSTPPVAQSAENEPMRDLTQPLKPTADISVEDPAEDHNKRHAPSSPSPSPSPKRMRTANSLMGFRGRTNLSQSRREKEMLRLLTELGGIANVSSKEFVDAHATLLERMVQANEAVSDNRLGTKIDKKTIDATMNGLQEQGLVKLVTTVIHNRQVKVAYLVEVAQEDLNTFLSELSRNMQPTFTMPSAVKRLDTPLPYGGSKTTKVVRPRNSVALVEQAPAMELESTQNQNLSADDVKVKEALLNDPQTVKQLYGYITAKIARVRELHLHVMKLFDENQNGHIVSSEQQVLHMSYFYRDLPISVYCAIVSSLAPTPQLQQLLSTPEGRATPLSRLPASLADVMEVNKARSRSRVLDALVTLQDLRIITPLLPTESEQPWLRCPPNRDYPTAFEITHCEGPSSSAPHYWRFHTSADIHFWVLDEASPAFWKTAPLQSHADATAFWSQLQRASVDQPFAEQVVSEREQGELQLISVPPTISVKLAKLLRRSTQWRPTYIFSDGQKAAMKRYTDIQMGGTPLEDADGGVARLKDIADIVSAPTEEVSQFYVHERSRMLRNIEKMRKKAAASSKAESSKRRADTGERANLAQKAAEARAQRERDWEEMLSRLHPEGLPDAATVRVQNVRKRFLQAAGKDLAKWESEVNAAVEQSKAPATHAPINRLPLSSTNTAQFVPLPIPVHTNEKSVEELIALQGPALEKPDAKTKKKKGKEKEGGDGKVIRRRSRFAWTKDFEELARDASAVIRARHRDSKKLDWSALEQIFRAVSRNTVRQKIVQLRESATADAYFKRLEDKWYELWAKYRGTPELPDHDPTSLSNFDLIAHITFLRQHVDKNALRVGFVESEEKAPAAALPSTVSALTSQFTIVEKPLLAPTYDFMWNNAAEEGREKLLAQRPFVLSAASQPSSSQAPPMRVYPTERVYIGDAAVKMMLGTPNEIYDADSASEMLKSAGSEAVDIAVKDMLERGVVSKLVRDPKKSKPGRMLKISDQNQNALSGPVATELFQDASTLEDALLASQQDDPLAWRDWPLTASDGDVAALVELVSEGRIDFKIDTSGPQMARIPIDWNSKKADDDHIETAIYLRCREDPIGGHAEARSISVISNHSHPSRSPLIEDPDADQPASTVASQAPSTTAGNPAGSAAETADGDVHGKTLTGERACCRQEVATISDGADVESDMIMDCQVCLRMEATKMAQSDELSSKAWTAVVDAREEGIPKHRLKAVLGATEDQLAGIVAQLVSRKLAFWAGYKSVVLVSAQFLSCWTVVIHPTMSSPLIGTGIVQDEQQTPPAPADMADYTRPVTRIFPRRWLDVHGARIQDVWEAACRAVIGTVIFHPGISQAELRWRLRTVYDRAEVHDVLIHLLDCKYLRVMRTGSRFVADGLADDNEENETFWFVGERRWYGL